MALRDRITSRIAVQQSQCAVPVRKVLGDVSNIQTKRTSAKPLLQSKNGLKKKINSGKLIISENENTGKEIKEIKTYSRCDKNENDLIQAFSNLKFSIDVDEDDNENPYMVSEYVKDIYAYFKSLELQYLVKIDFLATQKVTADMRSILVDWLVDVHVKFQLVTETLYMCIDIIDRYLQIDHSTELEQLQLVGVTALFIASKYEEMYPPRISDFVYITKKTYSANEICKMEIRILSKLNFMLNKPFAIHFLRRNSKIGGALSIEHAVAKYIIELSLVDYHLCTVKPSLIAASAICLSFYIMDENSTSVMSAWTPVLTEYTGYTFDELLPVVKKLAEMLINSFSKPLKAVQRKYSCAKLNKVSILAELKNPKLYTLAEITSANNENKM